LKASGTEVAAQYCDKALPQ